MAAMERGVTRSRRAVLAQPQVYFIQVHFSQMHLARICLVGPVRQLE